MELICLVFEGLPDNSGEEGSKMTKCIQLLSKDFKENTGIDKGTGWNRPRPRRIVPYVFTYPAKAEQELLERLKPYVMTKFQKITKIFELPVIGSALSKLSGIEPIDMDKVELTEEGKKYRTAEDIRIVVIGKVEDGYTETGVELL